MEATLEDKPANIPDALPAFHFKHPKLVDHGELEAILPNLSDTKVD